MVIMHGLWCECDAALEVELVPGGQDVEVTEENKARGARGGSGFRVQGLGFRV